MFLGQFTYSQSWINRPNLPSTARAAVGSFAIGSKGYFIGGETSGSGNLVDTWEYDTATNTWAQKANYPGIGTQKGVAFSINGVGYYGLGTGGGSLYSYNSNSDTWTQKTTCNIASVNFWSTTFFVVGTKAYFLDANTKFFCYDSVADSWSLLSDFIGTKRATAVGFSINDKGYVCTGLNATSAGNTMLNDLWEYNPTNNVWTQKTSLPSTGRYASFGFSFNNKGYLLGGEKSGNVMTNEFWEYNPTSDSWTSLTNYIGGAKNYLSGFVINNSVYAGFGNPGFGVSFNEYGYFNQSSSFCTSLSGSLQNGLVGYWPFCGNANDDSGNGNNGTVNGATLTTDRFGNNNSAYNFDGNNNHILVSDNSTLSGFSDITISLWVNISQFPSASDPFSGLVTKWYGSGNCGAMTDNYACYLRTNNQFVAGTNQYRNYPNMLQSPSNLSTSNWYHLVIVHNSTTGGSIYINGSLVSTYNTSGALCSSTNPLYFGCDNGLGAINRFFNGKLDDIGIWNRGLTPTEVTQLFNQNQCITNITVTDTLIINVGQLSYTAPVTFANNITIYPNPANTQVNISFNNITDLAGGTIKIINSLGQQVATTPITLSGTNTTLALNAWGGTGLYFVQIINAQGQIIDIKKIILQ